MKISCCVAFGIPYLRKAAGSWSIFLLSHPSTCNGLASNCSPPPRTRLWSYISLSCPAC